MEFQKVKIVKLLNGVYLVAMGGTGFSCETLNDAVESAKEHAVGLYGRKLKKPDVTFLEEVVIRNTSYIPWEPKRNKR